VDEICEIDFSIVGRGHDFSVHIWVRGAAREAGHAASNRPAAPDGKLWRERELRELLGGKLPKHVRGLPAVRGLLVNFVPN